ncbi:3-oxoacyl-ACP synthase III family protein [Symbiopectobacterium sp. RP]|uniref:3-oxoacyl-ACP synthase III family protein n=1 Tax=Symbiopectobacterium sp. RP TaxID=3248553 RepID=UPI003D28A2FC
MSLSTFKHAKVSAIFCVLPENQKNIDDEIKFYENDAAKLSRNKKILGLGTRHVVPDGVTAADLCEAAARVLIEKMDVDVNEIDTLIMASINHDYIGNSDACIIQGKLGLSEECACFDTSGLGCTDAIYALWLAHSLVESGASKKCLVLEGSSSSLITNVRNRNANMLFGDAGAAILVDRSDKEYESFFHLKSLGKDWKKIVTPAGGGRLPVQRDIVDLEIMDPVGNPYHLSDSVMQGGDVFKFAIDNAPDSISKVIEYAKSSYQVIDFFAIHQANGQIVRTIINYAGLPKDKASAETFSKYGNCGGTSVLVNYCDQMFGKVSNSTLFVSFGVGLSVASCKLDLSDTINGGVTLYKTPDCIQSRDELISEWVKFIKNED